MFRRPRGVRAPFCGPSSALHHETLTKRTATLFVGRCPAMGPNHSPAALHVSTRRSGYPRSAPAERSRAAAATRGPYPTICTCSSSRSVPWKSWPRRRSSRPRGGSSSPRPTTCGLSWPDECGWAGTCRRCAATSQPSPGVESDHGPLSGVPQPADGQPTRRAATLFLGIPHAPD